MLLPYIFDTAGHKTHTHTHTHTYTHTHLHTHPPTHTHAHTRTQASTQDQVALLPYIFDTAGHKSLGVAKTRLLTCLSGKIADVVLVVPSLLGLKT